MPKASLAMLGRTRLFSYILPFVAYLHSGLGAVVQPPSAGGEESTDDLDDDGLLRLGVDVAEASSTNPTSKLSDQICWEDALFRFSFLTL